LSWDVQYGAYQSAVQLAGVALVLRLGPEAGDAAALVVGVEGQVQADGVVDAADETHAGVGLLFHDVSPCASCIIASTWELGKPLRLATPFPIGVGTIASPVIGSTPWADSSA